MLLFLAKSSIQRSLYSCGMIPTCWIVQPFLCFPPLPLNRRSFVSQIGRGKRIPLAQGQFLRFWRLNSLPGTWQHLGHHQCGPGLRELPRSFTNSPSRLSGTEICKPYPSSRGKPKEKQGCVKGADISGDLAIIAGAGVSTSQYREPRCAPRAS